MYKSVLALLTITGVAFAGPLLADCESEVTRTRADLDAAGVTKAERAAAVMLLEEAEAALADGDDLACRGRVRQARAMADLEVGPLVMPEAANEAPGDEVAR